ncbi:unnamed protein product [Polarella glacialis]|uniref:Uncharacterized protein n=1 Tax=Polarella glacialis TaxID=89957 RepID=A0A813GJ15_POLGL|nr:unnamed protein product [Polarella glacialis]
MPSLQFARRVPTFDVRAARSEKLCLHSSCARDLGKMLAVSSQHTQEVPVEPSSYLGPADNILCFNRSRIAGPHFTLPVGATSHARLVAAARQALKERSARVVGRVRRNQKVRIVRRCGPRCGNPLCESCGCGIAD